MKIVCQTIIRFALICSLGLRFDAAAVVKPVGQPRYSASGFSTNNIDRPLRYAPIGTDFVITNGGEFFNRSLYGGSSPFRVDAGDMPEFSLYLPGRGGNLRLGFHAAGQWKWLSSARQIVAHYRPGSMLYEIRDPVLGDTELRVTVLVTRADEGLILRIDASTKAELLLAFGGVNGMKGRRDGDIGCEVEPVGKFFQLRPEQCRSNTIAFDANSFVVTGKPGSIRGVVSHDALLQRGDANAWTDPAALFSSPDRNATQPVLIGRIQLHSGRPVFLGLQRLPVGSVAEEVLDSYREVSALANAVAPPKRSGVWAADDLGELFQREEAQRRAVAERVVAQTPDPFINAAMAALNIAADAVWDDRQNAFLHGGVAWRVRLLGWRVSYAGDALGWHDRTARHFEGFAKQQNTEPVPPVLPAPEESANLARNETGLHSNGDLTKSHYDMNLVGVDSFFRHLLWTGDREFAARQWATIERHLAWERRLFRREFGAEKLPLYEAYCCIWASDDLAYNGGGVTHASAYNLYHNRMAARVARLLGKDSTLYEREAELIERGMQENLWLADRGWFGEWKDTIGLQLVHPNAAAWTFYHTIDSGVPTPMAAWQMTRFVDTQIARFPIYGSGVPAGSYTIPTTSWMPYTWSLNNVVLGETMHSALAYWQANRPEGAFPLFKGAVLDSMYLGLCPGNVGMCTWFDANRRESQRDFGDGIGAMSRAVVEGLFGVQPDLLAGEITLRPGFPMEWNHARLQHPDFSVSFQRNGLRESYLLESRFRLSLSFKLEAAALRTKIVRVTVNGQPAKWRMVPGCVGLPRIEIVAVPAPEQQVVIDWDGESPMLPRAAGVVDLGETLSMDCGAKINSIADPQNALRAARFEGAVLGGEVRGAVGERTVFANVNQGDLRWWLPVTFKIAKATPSAVPVDWSKPLAGHWEVVDLTSIFNDSVTEIFRKEYRAPRSQQVSLAMPKQGFGSWCHPQAAFEVDDSGLRRVAAQGGGKIVLPNGVPLATTGDRRASNIAFVSRWESYPSELAVPLHGKSARAFLLMAGSTDAMKSRFDNGEAIVSYADGTTTRLALHNPTTWWPIDQDYYIDDFAFSRPEPLPVRIDLATGRVRVLAMDKFKGQGGVVPGGAATVLDLPLDGSKELSSLTVRAIANEVVIGLMSVTLRR